MEHQTNWFKELTEASEAMEANNNNNRSHRFKWLIQGKDNRHDLYTNYFNNQYGKKKNTPDKRENDKTATPETKKL